MAKFKGGYGSTMVWKWPKGRKWLCLAGIMGRRWQEREKWWYWPKINRGIWRSREEKVGRPIYGETSRRLEMRLRSRDLTASAKLLLVVSISAMARPLQETYLPQYHTSALRPEDQDSSASCISTDCDTVDLLSEGHHSLLACIVSIVDMYYSFLCLGGKDVRGCDGETIWQGGTLLVCGLNGEDGMELVLINTDIFILSIFHSLLRCCNWNEEAFSQHAVFLHVYKHEFTKCRKSFPCARFRIHIILRIQYGVVTKLLLIPYIIPWSRGRQTIKYHQHIWEENIHIHTSVHDVHTDYRTF